MQGAHMQGADVLIAVDVGTSGARASGFDASGAPLDEVRRSYPTYLPAEGWAEHGVGALWPCAVGRCARRGGLPRRLGYGRCGLDAGGVSATGSCAS